MRRYLQVALGLWKRFAHVLGVVNTHLVLFVTYWVVFGIVAVVLKLLRKDYLRLRWKGRDGSYWLDREPDVDSIERARYQF